MRCAHLNRHQALQARGMLGHGTQHGCRQAVAEFIAIATVHIITSHILLSLVKLRLTMSQSADWVCRILRKHTLMLLARPARRSPKACALRRAGVAHTHRTAGRPHLASEVVLGGGAGVVELDHQRAHKHAAQRRVRRGRRICSQQEDGGRVRQGGVGLYSFSPARSHSCCWFASGAFVSGAGSRWLRALPQLPARRRCCSSEDCGRL